MNTKHTPTPWATILEAIGNIPQKDAFCHCGICEQAECGRCSKIIAGHEAVRELSTAHNELVAAAEAAYTQLLQMPDNALRLRSQKALCLLRDAIAEATGREQRDVQEDFEERAVLAKVNGKE